MAVPYSFLLEFFQGDSLPLIVSMDVDPTGLDQDLTGFTVKLYIKDKLFTASIEKTQAVFRLTQLDTKSLPVGTYLGWILITKGLNKLSFRGRVTARKGRQ